MENRLFSPAPKPLFASFFARFRSVFLSTAGYNMRSFDADFPSFDSRRDRVFSKPSFSLRPDADPNDERKEREKRNASSFLQAFESRWNAESTFPSRPTSKSCSTAKNRASKTELDKKAETNENVEIKLDDQNDRREFERLRRLAGNLAGRDEKSRRDAVAQRFVDDKFDSQFTEKINFNENNDVEDADVDAAFRLDGPPDATATIAGKAYYYFGGDGFLGLQADPEMLATACEAALKYGLASATSRRSFVPAPIKDVERNAAKFFGSARAFYSLNETTVGETLLKSILGSVDRFFVDEISLPFWRPIFEKLEREEERGAKSTKTPTSEKSRSKKWTPISFRHCDALDLREKMRRNLEQDERPLAITDGVFADRGTLSPLDAIVDALEIFPGAALLLNDSSGIGVLGENGRGSFEHFCFDSRQINQTFQETTFDAFENGSFDDDTADEFWRETPSRRDAATFGRRTGVRLYSFASLAKAAGGFGCVAAGSELFVEKLNESSDEFAGTVPSNPIAAASARGLKILATVPEIRERLRENVERLRDGLRELGIEIDDAPTPIVAFQLGSPQNMRRVQRELAERRILVSFLPTRRDRSRGFLRVAVFSTHSPESIDALIDSLREVI